MDFPQIFTFYSFKGGVGRSMAVLNVAYAMAAKGRHVLVLDMDLEAPGLSGFLGRHGEIGAPARQDMWTWYAGHVTRHWSSPPPRRVWTRTRFRR
jgi:cellulose biosynthesis protein BcsQ